MDVNKKIAIVGVAIVVLLVLSPVFYGWVMNQNGPEDFQRKNVPVLDDHLATTLSVNQTVEGMNNFSIDFFNNVNAEGKNVFFSPWSLSTALAMTSEGARGQTADEIYNVFHMPKDDMTRRSSFASIYNSLNSKNAQYALWTANAIWAQKDYQILTDFKDNTKKYYDAEMRNLDFKTAWEESRKTINQWVDGETLHKITDLLPPGSLDTHTRMVLTNAIYYKGNWISQFDKGSTKDAPFWNTTDRSIQVKMMENTGEKAVYPCMATGDMQMLELPYVGNDTSMLVILPSKDDPQFLANNITYENVKKWRSELDGTRVDVYFPRFTFKTRYLLKSTLSDMGMPTAFNPDRADFSGIDGSRNLSIKDVIHQAFVSVDESGTEAAAATAVIMAGTTSVGPPPVPVFRADHPFVFIIQDKRTGAFLFMGKVANPLAA